MSSCCGRYRHKSKIEPLQKSRESRSWDVSATISLVGAATEVRDRFWLKRYGPSRRLASSASTALRIFVRHPKKTFATVADDRFQLKDGKAVEHLVPLSSAAREVIASLPRIKGGKYLFSLNGGKRPLSMTGPIKADLDNRMLRTLRALASRRGEDHEQVTLPAWVNQQRRGSRACTSSGWHRRR